MKEKSEDVDERRFMELSPGGKLGPALENLSAYIRVNLRLVLIGLVFASIRVHSRLFLF